MTKREKIAALPRMTMDRGCTAAEVETARRLAVKLQLKRAPSEAIAWRFDLPVTIRSSLLHLILRHQAGTSAQAVSPLLRRQAEIVP